MKIFIDTAPFIYIVENHPEFAETAIRKISTSITNGDTLVTSVVTLMEFGVKPEREERQDIIQRFENLLEELEIELLNIDKMLARRAYQLRAKYTFLKGMDALQLAAALSSNCEEFVTNDIKLKKINELKVILLREE